jgi:competence protein ComEC
LVLSRFLSRPVSTFGLILTLAWYVILVGSPASVLRAAFMLIFSLIGRVYFGRQVTALYSFFITFFILSLTQVQFLFEVGFQLSFAATFGILFVFPELSQLDQFISLDAWTDWLVLKTGVRSFWLNAWEKIKAALWLSLAAQLLTFPVVVNTFGIYSPWGFVTTILFSGGLAALITLIFLFLIFCLVLGWSDFFVHLIIAPCAWSLNFLLSIFNQISAAIADYLGPPWVIPWQFRPWQLMIYYGLLLVIFFLIKKRRLRYHAYL